MADSKEKRTASESATQSVPEHEVAQGRQIRTTTMEAKLEGKGEHKLKKPSVLSRSGSKTLTSDMVVALTGQTDFAPDVHEQHSLAAGVPPSKGTPMPFSHSSPSSSLPLPASPYQQTHLDIPVRPTPDHASSPLQAAAEEGNFDETPTAGLDKAYATVLSSANMPIGHQSSGSLRHVVLSRTTSSSAVSSINAPGNINSSQESFVHVSDVEFSPVIKDSDDLDASNTPNKVGKDSRAVGDSAVLNPRGSDAGGDFATVKAATIKPRSKVVNAILESSSNTETQQTPSTDIRHAQQESGPDSPWIPSLPHSPQHPGAQSVEDLAQSYDSAQDPNNLKFWWEAGVRDGDPVGTPPAHPLSSVESSLAASKDIGDPALPDKLSSSSETNLSLPSNNSAREVTTVSNSLQPHGIGPEETVGSEDDVELGREFQTSLSDMFPRNKQFWGTEGSMQVVVEDDDHYSLKSVANSGNIRMESVEPFAQSQSGLELNEWKPEFHVTSSQESRQQAVDKSSQEALAGTPLRGHVGILSPEKPIRAQQEPASAAGVNPSKLRSSYELQPWDPVVDGGYVTFKFLLLMLSNSLRCYSPDLPLHPIVHYIAKFSMVPEDSLRQLFVKEIAYAAVTDQHITKHDLYLWYRHLFRTTPPASAGSFHVIIASIIQIALDLPLEPMEQTLPKLQGNSEVVCMLPLGTCRIHRDLAFDAFDMDERPQTPHGARPRTTTREDAGAITPRGRSGGPAVSMYDVRDDLELSSSSESSISEPPRALPQSSSSDPFIDRISRSGPSTALNTLLLSAKGKGKMHIVEAPNQAEDDITDEIPASASGAPALLPPPATISQLSSDSLENSIVSDLMFSDSKWNVFNRVIGLLSHTLQIPWNDVLEDPRIVYTLIHDARVSVESFKQYVLDAEGEELAEKEDAIADPGQSRWKADIDAEGRWTGQSLVSAMFELLPARHGVKRVTDLPPFQRALLHLVRACDEHWMHRPVEETLAFLERFDRHLQYEPWTVGKAARQAIQSLKSHLDSNFGDYLAPEARNELKEFVRVQEYQIGSSNKDWQGQEALDALQTARSMMEH